MSTTSAQLPAERAASAGTRPTRQNLLKWVTADENAKFVGLERKQNLLR